MSWQADFLEQIAQRHICVVGDIMLDRYLEGRIDRISPEAPVPVVLLQSVESRLGGAGNVALNLVQLGCDVTLFGVVGKDAHGETIRKLASEHGINSSGIFRTTDRPTTVKTRVLAGNQHVLRVDEEVDSPLSEPESSMLADRLLDFLDSEKPDALIFQDYNKGALSPELVAASIQKAHDLGVVVAVDPKDENFFTYSGVEIFKPNFRELKAKVPFPLTYKLADLRRASDFLRERLSHGWSCFTLGEHGMYIDDGDIGKIYSTVPRDVVDVCGAGDAVISVLTLGYLNGLNPDQLAILANSAGGVVCEHVGVTALTMQMLSEEITSVRVV